jgi:NADH-quinone oxidoreductase subunit G
LLEPRILSNGGLITTDWKTAITHAALQLRHFSGWETAVIASGRMTNEELWLTSQIAGTLQAQWIDIVPRRGPNDDILLSADRNPNTNGARSILNLGSEPGSNLPAIVEAVKTGQIKAILALAESPTAFGISVEQLAQLPALVIMDILANESTNFGTAVLPASGFAEKRGSMINGEGRLQRLNRAVRPPGSARDDWEILRDLLQAIGGSTGIYSIEDVFRQMSESIAQFNGLSLAKIGDLGVHVMDANESPPPPFDPESTEIERAEAQRPPGR